MITIKIRRARSWIWGVYRGNTRLGEGMASGYLEACVQAYSFMKDQGYD